MTLEPSHAAGRLGLCLASALTLIAMVGGCAFPAVAGTITFEYFKDGDEPGTMWVYAHLDPINWGPCEYCLLPDFSRLHVSPAPLQPAPYSGSSYPWASIYYDETGARVQGDGFTRILVLDISTTYVVSDAYTKRSEFAPGQGGYPNRGPAGPLCIHEVTDYPILEVPVLAVSSEVPSLSVIKSRYND